MVNSRLFVAPVLPTGARLGKASSASCALTDPAGRGTSPAN